VGGGGTVTDRPENVTLNDGNGLSEKKAGEFTRRVFLIFGSNLFGAVLGAITLPLIGRYILQTDFGFVGFALGFMGALSFLRNMGFSKAHVKYISEGHDIGECVGTTMAIFSLLSLVFSGAVLSTLFIWTHVFGKEFSDPEAWPTLYAILLYFIILSIQNVFFSTFQGEIKTALQESLTFSMNVSRFALTLIVVFIRGGAFALALTYTLSALTSLLVGFGWFLKHEYAIKKPSFDLAKKYARFAIPLSISGSITAISNNIDRVMIQFFWDSKKVATYFMAQRVTSPILTLGFSVSLIFFPAAVQYLSRGKTEEARKLAREASRYTVIVLLPAVAIFTAMPEPIMNLIGAAYARRPYVLIPLSMFAFTRSLMVLFNNLNNALNRPKVTGFVLLVMSGVNILLNLILIPTSLFGFPLFGLAEVGAGIATAISCTIALLTSIWFANKQLGGIIPTTWAKEFVSAAVMGVFLYVLSTINEPVRFYEVLLYAGAGVGVYSLCLYALRDLTERDFSLFFESINPHLMGRYVYHEVKGERKKKKEGKSRGKDYMDDESQKGGVDP